ncbi:Alpha-dioxygenase 1 [Gracilariopsis chorda]|uniref:Alpha-dioxygenase 1 n=1 Tax=Gracilariopsis chorda TaxID=448386 RepID=A0A2V3II02_9FLOR|nr:Alpha-dioxygenase 1 [Gracilariopsis chorda]|eukprot:PXF41735.1 Alpha-dioxygenase 1 [Gracilariopsis chorda]
MEYHVVGLQGDEIQNTLECPGAVWDSIVSYPCGNLDLFNYPRALRDLAPTDEFRLALPDHVDLASLDLYRDRERDVRNYNDSRRALRMEPFQIFVI